MANRDERSIFFVDDDEPVRKLVKQQFRHWYEVHTFDTAEALLSALQQSAPSLVMLDWLLAGMDGIALCTEIRKQQRFNLVPIAFYSGVEPSVENMREAFEAGAQSFISKASSFALLLAQVKALIDSHERLADFVQQRRVVLSVLKHDIANLLTGVTSGVEVLSMDPAFKTSRVTRQTTSILESAGRLRLLLDDLNEVLVPENVEGAETLPSLPISEVLDDLCEYLKGIPRETTCHVPQAFQIRGERYSLGRCLYYLIRFVDAHAPHGLPVEIEATPQEQNASFSLRVDGCHKSRLEQALSTSAVSKEHDHDVLFVHYARQVLYRHKASLSLVEQAQRTEVRFSLPLALPAGTD